MKTSLLDSDSNKNTFKELSNRKRRMKTSYSIKYLGITSGKIGILSRRVPITIIKKKPVNAMTDRKTKKDLCKIDEFPSVDCSSNDFSGYSQIAAENNNNGIQIEGRVSPKFEYDSEYIETKNNKNEIIKISSKVKDNKCTLPSKSRSRSNLLKSISQQNQ